jgi:hypothetical protein
MMNSPPYVKYIFSAAPAAMGYRVPKEALPLLEKRKDRAECGPQDAFSTYAPLKRQFYLFTPAGAGPFTAA